MASDIEYSVAPGQGIGLPFSPLVAYEELLFCSGQVGFLPGTTTLVAGGIEAQTRQTMENLRANLERAGGSLERIVKVLVFLGDGADFAAFNDVYASYFSPDRFPARSTLVAGFAAPGVLVEIECIAVRSASEPHRDTSQNLRTP